MAASFNTFSAIWSMWQIHSTGRQLYLQLPQMIARVQSGTVGGVAFNSDHASYIHSAVKQAADQVESVISGSNVADVKRLAEAIKGDGSADYIADVQAWRTATAQLVSDIETAFPTFPEPAFDLTQGQLNGLNTRLQAIKTASE